MTDEAHRSGVRLQPEHGQAVRCGIGLGAYGSPRRGAKLDGLEGWLEERFTGTAATAEVVRQDLKRELSVDAK